MSKFWRGIVVSTLVALIILLVVSTLADLAQSAQAGSAALLNPGFEEGFHNYDGVGELTVANDWYPWYSEVDGRHRPEYKPETRDVGSARVYDGDYAQKLFTTYSMQDGGLYQLVTTIPGHWYQFECKVYVWSSNYDNPDASRHNGKLAAMVGINPWGDANVLRRTTIWGKESVGVDGKLAYDEWITVQVIAQAWADKIVVTTRSEAMYPVKHNDSYWDQCKLSEFDLTPDPCPTIPPGSTPPVSGCPSIDAIRTVVAEREPVTWPR